MGMNADELVAKWRGVIDASKIAFTWTEEYNLAYLAEVSQKARWAIESGTYMGASAYVMLAANPTLHLWCCDPFMVAGTEHVTRQNLRPFIDASRCEIIPKRTVDAVPMLQHMKHKIDLVFVDDGHAFEDVVTDIRSYKPLIRRGGLLCGHDFETNPENDVARAVRQTLPGHYEAMPRMWAFDVKAESCCGKP